MPAAVKNRVSTASLAYNQLCQRESCIVPIFGNNFGERRGLDALQAFGRTAQILLRLEDGWARLVVVAPHRSMLALQHANTLYAQISSPRSGLTRKWMRDGSIRRKHDAPEHDDVQAPMPGPRLRSCLAYTVHFQSYIVHAVVQKEQQPANMSERIAELFEHGFFFETCQAEPDTLQRTNTNAQKCHK